MHNIFADLPKDLSSEHFSDLLRTNSLRIERIVSMGHCSPEHGWYDQPENEWVMVLEGCGTLLFDDGREIVLKKGDYVNIPAHVRHKVTHTAAEQPTVWLALFYS